MRKAALTAALLAATPAAAQEPAPVPAWSFAASLYGWVPAIKTTVDMRFGEVDGKLSASDALSDLDFAFMGAFEARRGRWGLIGDLVYTDLTIHKATPHGLLFSEARVSTSLTMFSGYAAYRVHESPEALVDIAGGFRVLSADLDVTLAAAHARQDASAGGSKTWVEPVIGARAIFPVAESWFATAFADIGGTGSNEMSWQAYASVGYRFNERWSAQLGYRYLEIEQPISGNDTRLELYGPLLGATYRF